MASAPLTSPGKRATRIYTVALLVIGLFILSSQVLIRYVLDGQSADSHVIDLSSRQNTLSQRLATQALLFHQATDEQEKLDLKESLLQTMNLWETSHYALLRGDDSFQIPSDYNSKTVLKLFEQLEPSFLKVKGIVQRIQQSNAENNEVFYQNLTALMEEEALFSSLMDKIISQYGVEARARVVQVERTELVLTAITLIALLLTALFIFKPAVKQLDELIDNNKARRKNLEQANDDLAQKNLLSHQQTEKIADQHFLLKQQNENIVKANEELIQTQTRLEQVIAEREVYNQILQVQKQELEQAQTELHKLAVVVRETNNAVIITDAKGCIEYVNEGFVEITGYTLQEVIGQKPGDVLQGSKTDQEVIQQISEALKEGEIFDGEILNYHKEGSSYWTSLNICPVYNEQKELTNYVAINTDVSLQKQRSELLEYQKESLQDALQELQHTQMQLIHSEKLSSLGQLTAGIAHEINNPINFVLAGVQTLKAVFTDIQQLTDLYNDVQVSLPIDELKTRLTAIDEFKEDIVFEELNDDVKHLLADISLGAERTQNIVRSLQTFTRLDESESKPADIHENLEATLTILQSKFDDRVAVIKEYDENLPFVVCNIGQVNQVFMNLIDNASQAISGKGQVRIQTKLVKEEVQIVVADTGKGMDEATMDKIFQPFFTTKAAGEGTGLGLAISTSIIEKHQGKIEVTSKQGEGTTFTVHLPLNVEH